MTGTQVCFLMPQDILEDLDNYCEKNGLNRSELLRHLIRVEIYTEQSLKKGGEKE